MLTSLGCAFTSLLLWLIILSRAELSAVYPMLALSYALTAMAARLLLGEQLSSLRVLGITLICLGVFLIARS
ncbi:MAG: EamA family transporter [Desulfobaccales bacterium]